MACSCSLIFFFCNFPSFSLSSVYACYEHCFFFWPASVRNTWDYVSILVASPLSLYFQVKNHKKSKSIFLLPIFCLPSQFFTLQCLQVVIFYFIFPQLIAVCAGRSGSMGAYVAVLDMGICFTLKKER
jgi:hypothetical protein